MKLKPIPANTVVHTSTEAEAKELLAILHENGYRGADGTILNSDKYARANKCYYIFAKEKGIEVENSPSYNFAEFKERYVIEEENPQPKFHLGERIRIASSGEEDFINMITEDDCYELLEHRGKYTESDLIPYTEPETKPTEDMETKEEPKGETKELNLREFLRGHEGEMFFAPICGTEIELKKLFSSFLSFYLDKENGCTVECDTKGNQAIGTLDEVGRFQTVTYQHGSCMVYPSKVLYEQYPLDAYTAWMKWQQEQKKYALSVAWVGNDVDGANSIMFFRTSADREKAIEEIKAVIGKYAK